MPSAKEVGDVAAQSAGPTNHAVPLRVTANVRMVDTPCLTVTFTVVLSPTPLPAVPAKVGVVDGAAELWVGVVTVTVGATWSVNPAAVA